MDMVNNYNFFYGIGLYLLANQDGFFFVFYITISLNIYMEKIMAERYSGNKHNTEFRKLRTEIRKAN